MSPPVLTQHHCPIWFDYAETLKGAVPTGSFSMRGVNSIFTRMQRIALCTQYRCRKIATVLYTLFYGRGSTNSDARHRAFP